MCGYYANGGSFGQHRHTKTCLGPNAPISLCRLAVAIGASLVPRLRVFLRASRQLREAGMELQAAVSVFLLYQRQQVTVRLSNTSSLPEIIYNARKTCKKPPIMWFFERFTCGSMIIETQNSFPRAPDDRNGKINSQQWNAHAISARATEKRQKRP